MKQINTLEVLKRTMKDNEYSFDIYFRMAVIDEYLNGNNKIWELYNKLQITRCNQIKIIPREMVNHKKEFIELINSIKINGYYFNNPILVNKEGLIIDGAHRMACALYFDIPLISIYTTNEHLNTIPIEYSKKWFQNNDLTECIYLAEIQQVKVKEKLKCINQKKF